MPVPSSVLFVEMCVAAEKRHKFIGRSLFFVRHMPGDPSIPMYFLTFFFVRPRRSFLFEQRGVATCCTECPREGVPLLLVAVAHRLGVIRLRPSFPRTSGGV